MRVLVCGGRDFTNDGFLDAILDGIDIERPITTIIEGGARGADTMAARWGLRRGVRVETYHADWARYGRSAGHERNRRMRDANPDVVVAFPSPKSVGTWGMVGLIDGA